MGKKEKALKAIVKYLEKRTKKRKHRRRAKSSSSDSRTPSPRRQRRTRSRERSHERDRTRSRSPGRRSDSRSPSSDNHSDSNKENTAENEETQEEEPANPFREALGADYDEPIQYEGQIHEDISKRFSHILTNGLSKEERESITKKYKVPLNCTSLDAPLLNPEVKSVLTESSKLRDYGIEIAQRQVGMATAIIGKAMTNLMENEDFDKLKILSEMADASKLLTDVNYHQTKTRLKLISPSLDKNFNQIVAKTKRDTFLYGTNLSEMIKNAKEMKQAVAQIKKPVQINTNRQLTTHGPTTGNKNGPPPKTGKPFQARGGPKTAQSSDQRRFRPNQYRHRSERAAHHHAQPRGAPTRR